MDKEKKKYYNGELIVEKAKINWIVLIIFAVIGVVAFELLLQLVLTFVTSLSKILWIVRIASWAIAVLAVLRILLTRLYITERRVLYRTGLLGVFVKDFPIEHVDTISYKVTLLGRLFFYGTIIIMGSSGDEIVLKRVRNVKKFKNAIFEAIERNKIVAEPEEEVTATE